MSKVRHTLVEYEQLKAIDLPAHTAARLNLSKALTVTPSDQQPGRWDLKAANHVGVLQVEDLEVVIVPKVPVARLLFLIAYSLRTEGWQELATALGTADQLVSAIAHAFVLHSERALRLGILQGYVATDEALPGLRGRLREADQLRHRFGLPIPLEVTFDDFTVDTAENQLLRSAAHRLLMIRDVEALTRRRLRRLDKKLQQVSLLVPGQIIPEVRIDRRNRMYAEAVALADLVLRSTSIESGGASAPAITFLFDMNKVFEDFATRALEMAFRSVSGRLVPQRRVYLDIEDSVLMKPDLTLTRDGLPLAVADLKYKSIQLTDMPNADVYQMLAYCLALGLEEGHLVYAAGNEEPGTRVIRSTSTRITTWALDLDQQPDDVLSAVDAIARTVAARALAPAGAR